MNVCYADLHVHTALSPCADDEMTPPAIVDAALAEGLAMIAVCDHNSARNVAAVQEAAGERLAVLAGMEITTVEECHVVALFPDASAAQAAGAEVGATLGPVDDGYETFFGEQHVLDAAGAETAREALALATALSRHIPAGSEREAEFAVYGLPILHSSDAHYRADVGAARTAVTCERPDFGELALAIRGLEGRSVGDA